MSPYSSTRLMSLSLFVFSIFVRSFITKSSKLIRSSTNTSKSHLKVLNQSNSPPDIDHTHDSAYAFYEALRAYKDPVLSTAINKSLNTLADALRLYGPNRLISSFNGGKDAVVVMHLIRAAVAKYSRDKNLSNDSTAAFRPQFIYFAIKEEFPEVLNFIKESEKKYNLNLITYDCGIIQGLEQYVNSLNEPNPLIAFVLGTRVGDSNAVGQETFCPSSAWMKVPFMRVNPILNWDYGQVWKFLRDFGLEYCSLYDDGYTSLGKTSDTQPNPYLKKKDCNVGFYPAHMLSDWTKERAGRIERRPDSLVSTPAESVKSSSESASVIGDSTTAMLIIGDEALTSNYLSGAMKALGLEILSHNHCVMVIHVENAGVRLKKLSMINADINEASVELRLLSQNHNKVLAFRRSSTRTENDPIFKAIANAFALRDEDVSLSLASSESSAIDSSSSKLKARTIITNSDTGKSSTTVIQYGNVYVLPDDVLLSKPENFQDLMRCLEINAQAKESNN